MGAISKFIRDLDPGKETEDNLKETLNILVKLAQSKLDNFRLEMNAQWRTATEDSLAPGVTKDYQDEQMHVLTSSDPGPMQDGIAEIVDAAFSLGEDSSGKNVGAFIKKLALQGLNMVLASGSAEEHMHRKHIIYPDGNFVCRCDVWYWRYSMTTRGFQKKVEHMVVYRMQYGAVDIREVDPVALAHWFDRWNLDTELASQMLEKITDLVQRAHKPMLRGMADDTMRKKQSWLPVHRSDIIENRAALLARRGIHSQR